MAKKLKTSVIISGWKIVLRYLFSYRREMVVISILGIISAVGNGTIPFIVGKFFDAILNFDTTFASSGVMLWIVILGVWLGIQIVTSVVDWVMERKRRAMDTTLHVDFAAKGYSYLLLLPMDFHKSKRMGETSDRINNAAGQISNIARIIINFAPQILSAFIGVVIVAYINPFFAGILLLGIVIYVGLLVKTVSPAAEQMRIARKSWREAYGDAYDAVANVQAIKQVTAEDSLQRKIKNAFLVRTFNLWMKVEYRWSNIGFFQSIVVIGTQLSIFILAAFLIAQKSMSIGDLIALTGYASMVFGPFAQVAFNWQSIQNGAIAAVEADKILSHETERYIPENATDVTPFVGSVEFKNVEFGYDANQKVLKGISFKVAEGQKIALVGESGVGKSTAIELISGYYMPNKGRVYVSGVPTDELNLKKLREKIAIVAQEPVLFNETIRHNIAFGSPRATDAEVRKAAREAHADVFIKNFEKGYKQMVGERGIKLSVGQKQRVAIARAILRNPKILILDEPTSALDAKTEKFITNSLKKLMEGRTTFVIAHRLSTVREADRILVFEKGQIVENGTHHELLKIKDGVYRRLYEYQIGLD
ncbi:MAG: ABC transporter ATP-binding protein [Candidatus Pacebacteria bacterium]|nr:ABC transporter ATP-binding protein [Candidatus Paceibacterota bacterium]